MTKPSSVVRRTPEQTPPALGGRELDAAIAEAMGWTRAPMKNPPNRHWPLRHERWRAPETKNAARALPHFSMLIEDAWLVVEWFAKEHGAALHLAAHRHENPPPDEAHRAAFWSNRDSIQSLETRYGETAPLAICRAALASLSVLRPREETK